MRSTTSSASDPGNSTRDSVSTYTRTSPATSVKEEHAEIYDYTNATIDELRKDGTKKLADLQTKSEIKATTSTTLDAQLGDRLTGIDAEHGIKCTAEIQKKILKISNGVTETDYELAAIN